jgi:hypothetical protein
MNTKTPSIFVALEQYPNISVEEFEPEFLAENVINKTQKIYIKDCGKVIFELLLAPPFGVSVKSPMGIEILSQEKAYDYIKEEYCSVIDLTQAPTYLEKIHTEEVLKSLENELKQNNFYPPYYVYKPNGVFN